MGGIYILLGTNLGDKKQNLSQAKELITKQAGAVLAESAIYETAAWGKEDQDSFYNQVIEIDSTLKALDLLEVLLTIETEMGRIRFEKWGERLIDLDILYFREQLFAEENLKIPHPGIPDRRFTLTPLVEIAPQLVHPILQETQEALLQKCPDSLSVKKIS